MLLSITSTPTLLARRRPCLCACGKTSAQRPKSRRGVDVVELILMSAAEGGAGHKEDEEDGTHYGETDAKGVHVVRYPLGERARPLVVTAVLVILVFLGPALVVAL